MLAALMSLRKREREKIQEQKEMFKAKVKEKEREREREAPVDDALHVEVCESLECLLEDVLDLFVT